MGTERDLGIQPAEQPAYAATRVDPYVMAKEVPECIGRVIDERQQPEYEALPDEEPMRLERIEPVWGKDDDRAARSHNADGLLDRRPVVQNVFDHLVEKDHV